MSVSRTARKSFEQCQRSVERAREPPRQENWRVCLSPDAQDARLREGAASKRYFLVREFLVCFAALPLSAGSLYGFLFLLCNGLAEVVTRTVLLVELKQNVPLSVLSIWVDRHGPFPERDLIDERV